MIINGHDAIKQNAIFALMFFGVFWMPLPDRVVIMDGMKLRGKANNPTVTARAKWTIKSAVISIDNKYKDAATSRYVKVSFNLSFFVIVCRNKVSNDIRTQNEVKEYSTTLTEISSSL